MMASLKLSKTNMRLTLALLAVLLSVTSKLWLTDGSLLPGVDGAYYWVQVRSLLTTGNLAFDDLPAIFWVQSVFSTIFGDIELGVRISDAVLPALSAIPIYLLLKNSKQTWLPAFAVLVALLHPVQLFFFTGDFIKNAAAIPMVFFLGWILQSWESRPVKFSAAGLLLCLGVLGLSHFGTLLESLMLLCLWALFYLRQKPLRFWLVFGASTIALVMLTLITLAILVPARFNRLVEFVTQPSAIFDGPFWRLMPYINADASIIFAMFSGQIGGLCLGFLVWKNRRNLNRSSLSLAASGAVSSLILSSPLVGIEWASRLIALSFAPLLITALVLISALKSNTVNAVVALLAAATLATSAFFAPGGAKATAVSEVEYQDLLAAAAKYSFPDNSIVVARHGLEYLVAWTMKTHVIQEETYRNEDLGAYDAVFLLSTDDGAAVGYGYGPADKGGMNKPPLPKDEATSPSNGQVVYKQGRVVITKIG